MLIFWSLVRNSVVLAVYLLFSVACFLTVHEHLGMDYIDLYIYHMWDWLTPIEDVLEGLNKQVQKGKVRYIGISNCFAWQLVKANMIAERENWAKFVSVQGHYNLIFREEEREMVTYCKEENIALTPYSALAAGRLSKSLMKQVKDLKKIKLQN